MNAQQLARTAYGSSSHEVRTERGVEYDVFARVTAALRAATQPDTKNFPKLMKALDDNGRLWTLIASDVSDKGNKLPQQLRAQIFYLAEFTLTHTPKVVRGKADAGILIEVNTAVMRGLRGQETAR